jgi:hypothetical protein
MLHPCRPASGKSTPVLTADPHKVSRVGQIYSSAISCLQLVPKRGITGPVHPKSIADSSLDSIGDTAVNELDAEINQTFG